MGMNSIYSKLGYTEFLNTKSEIASIYPDYEDIEMLGVDKVYFSGENPAIFFIEVKSFNDLELHRIASIQQKAWNYRKVLLLFALSDTEIRIYNCHEKPSYISNKENVGDKLENIQIFQWNEQSDEETLTILTNIFSRIGVDCGLLWTTDYNVRKKVNIQKRLDKYLVQSLLNTAYELEKQGIDDKDIIHALLMRSLFILFLEDKGAAAEAGLYEHIKKGARSYFDILEDPEATYQLFEEVQVHFNGNILPVLSNERKVVNQEHLKLIRKCFIDGDISSQPKMFDDWRLFDFKIIQIELLSEIYENFLGELKRVRGQFYTPHSLVELILKDKLPTNKTTFNVKVLDIACGSGIFLVESYRRLIKRWKRANHSEQISFKTLNKLLVNNIYGIEIDKTAIKVAALSLYLALVDELDPKTLWIKTDYQLPFLIFDPDDQTIPIENQGKNLWRRDTIGEVNADEFIKADLVVGNPPFGTKKIMKSIINYLNKKKYPMQMVLAFIDKATTFAPKGEIALIFNTKSLTNTNKKYQNFRKWLFNKNHVNKIYNLSIYRNVKRDFGGKLFEETTVPISIIYFQKENPSTVSDTIEYVAPKTYVKSNLVDGLVIDSSDVKFLPRSECQKPDTRIWKIAMWGNIHDFRLIERLNRKFPSIKQYMLEHDDCWSSGTGYISDSQHLEVVPPRLISTEKIRRYYTKPTASFANNRLYRKITKDLFTPPFIVVKEGQHNNEIAASYIDYETGSLKSTYVINGKVSSDLKKALVAYINSTFASYYLFLTTSSWGIERERILFEELLEMPSIISNISKKNLKDLSRLFDEIKEADESSKISDIRLRIDKVLYDVLGLNKKELVLISDCLKFQLDLFDKGIDSLGFHRTLQPENIAYAQMLSNELNTFLESSKTCVNAVIYDVGLHDPLNMTVLYFVKSKSGIMVKNIHKLRSSLLEIDKYMLQQKAGQSIYVQKQLRYFNSNAVYIIKPNQKRFWTCSQGIDDATSIIAEIISMEGAK